MTKCMGDNSARKIKIIVQNRDRERKTERENNGPFFLFPFGILIESEIRGEEGKVCMYVDEESGNTYHLPGFGR